MLYAVVAVIALILDQLLKYWTTINIALETGEKPLIPGLIHLSNVHNSGAAFSIFPGGRWFFVALCVLFVLAVTFLLIRNVISARGARWAAVIVMAGAVGNAIDRVISGYVVDMFEFDFKIFGHAFPVFNLADMYITLGVIVFCIFLLFEKPAGAAAKRTAKPEAKMIPEAETETRAYPAKTAEITVFPKSAQAAEALAGKQSAREPKPRQNPAAAVPVRQARQAGADMENRPVIYTQPAPIRRTAPNPAAKQNGAATAVERIDVRNGAAKTEQVVRTLVSGNSAGAPKNNTAAGAAAEETYNLEDILAEFKD